ncbi:nucleoporin nic96 [Trichoderma cornu-damae]|uniref:Nucleoporin nic96 n=1 Tax=Trichoderma cornu-damae TaxID=654480 RepID=A0A9P8TXH5_9HYPO|nr:nucleoporin nic96 [Trichoderma cornu-damae]
MDLGSARRGGSGPGAGGSVGSGSPITVGEAIKLEAEATAPSLTATAAMPNGSRAGATGATEAEEVETVTKKRKTGAGSRGVANLTPEQLAKKRANDREAQRAIRERTKNQIEKLERRIHELENQKPYQDLQVVVRAKEVVEAENAEIKRRLAAIIAMLQPLVGTTMAVPATNGTAHHRAASTSSGSPAGGMADLPRHAAQPRMQCWQSGDSGTPAALGRAGVAGAVDEGTQALLERQGQSLRHGLDFEQGRFDLNVVVDPAQAIPKLQRGIDGAQDTGEYHHVPMKHDWAQANREFAPQHRPTPAWDSPMISMISPASDSTPGVPPLGVARQDSVASQPGPGPGLVPASNVPIVPTAPYPDTRAAVPESPPQHSRPLRNCSPTCPLDALLLDFRSERHQRAAEGYQPHEVAGPRYPSVSSLLNPANSKYSHPVSKFFTDILTKFPEVSSLPEKVAVLYLMFLLMRWQISPTKENLERLPEWIHPLPCQFEIPHAAWMDFLPHPAMRDRVIRANNPTLFYFDNFFLPFTSTLTVSWPYEEAHTLLRNPDSDEIMINPVFESHMRNLNNWKLGRIFAETFPTLADTCQYWDDVNGQQSPE